VEDRNHTGIMLIDRNDELCILYEKANTQEEVMRKGNAHLALREPVTHLTLTQGKSWLTWSLHPICSQHIRSMWSSGT